MLPLDYKKKSKLLCNGEDIFFRKLLPIIKNKDLILFAHIKLIDIITVKKKSDRKFWKSEENKIIAKCVDFLVCDKHNYSPLLVIELNGDSHKSSKRIERDIFVRNALQSADIPLLEIIRNDEFYDTELLSQQIEEKLCPNEI